MKALPSYPNPALRGWRLPGVVPRSNLWYWTMRSLFRVTVTAGWKVRVFNRHYEPTTGGAVYVSNHQSFLDPILVSYSLRRPVNFMARDSLFRIPIFGPAIATVNAFPVRRGSADLAAMKESMRRLKQGGQLAVFAEGTRTVDGRIGQMLPGVAMLSQRAAEWTVPVVIDGAYECWPRSQILPGRGSIVVCYGKPMSQAETKRHTPDELMARLREMMIEIQSDIRRRLGKSEIRYD